MRSLSREKKKDGETNDRRERERERERRDSMQEQGKISLRRKSSELTRRFYIADGYAFFCSNEDFGRSCLSALSTDFRRKKIKERKREKTRQKKKKKKERKTIPTFFLVACCKVQNCF